MARRQASYTFLIYIIFALYLVNKTFNFITLPQAVLDLEKWIFLAIALLLLWGGYRSLKLKETHYMSQWLPQQRY